MTMRLQDRRIRTFIDVIEFIDLIHDIISFPPHSLQLLCQLLNSNRVRQVPEFSCLLLSSGKTKFLDELFSFLAVFLG